MFNLGVLGICIAQLFTKDRNWVSNLELSQALGLSVIAETKPTTPFPVDIDHLAFFILAFFVRYI